MASGCLEATGQRGNVQKAGENCPGDVRAGGEGIMGTTVVMSQPGTCVITTRKGQNVAELR